MKSRNTELQTSLKSENSKMKHATSAHSDKLNHKNGDDLTKTKHKTSVDSDKVKQKHSADLDKTNHTHSAESDKAKHAHSAESEKAKHANSHSDSDKHKEEKSFLKESLLLPSTSTGKTVSSSICEKSNVWAAHRLDEKKSDLDHMLYKTIVKLNTDRLAVVSELANLRKSSSTGNINKVGNGSDGNGHVHGSKDAKYCRSVSNSGHNSPLIAKKTPRKNKHDLERQRSGEGHSSSVSRSHIPKSSENSPAISPRPNHGHSLTASPALSGKGHHRTIMKKSDSPTKIAIKLGADSSSDESGSTDELEACDHHLSLTHGQWCRSCMDARSKSQMVENVTRRYAKQLSAKSRNDK